MQLGNPSGNLHFCVQVSKQRLLKFLYVKAYFYYMELSFFLKVRNIRPGGNFSCNYKHLKWEGFSIHEIAFAIL
jgi:hypothetical protein